MLNPTTPAAVEAEQIARHEATKSVLRERERELLELKGPCSSADCQLHYAHSGPCAIRQSAEPAAEAEDQHGAAAGL